MFIIVEGPDGAGKTTLIEKLLRSHPGSKRLHFSAPASPEAAALYYRIYAEAIKSADPALVTIFDRSWYSDMVYGPVMRGNQEMLDIHAEMLEAMVLAHGGGFVVYCTAPLKVLWARCTRRGENYIDCVERLGEISDKYTKILTEKCGLPIIRYDTAARW